MNSIWLKVAGAVAVVLLVIVVLGRFGGGDKPAPEAQGESVDSDRPKTVYDMFDRDAKEFRVDSQQEQAAEAAPSESVVSGQEAIGQAVPEQPQPTFEKLALEQEVEAQKFMEMALAERKRSRLPMMTPKLMVDYCREIIRRWPRSEHAFQARRMLADIPERYQRMYNITAQEKDLSSFYQ